MSKPEPANATLVSLKRLLDDAAFEDLQRRAPVARTARPSRVRSVQQTSAVRASLDVQIRPSAE